MNRREFIRNASLAGFSLLLPSLSLSRASHQVSFTYEVKLPYKGDVRLWLPIPADTEYQRLTGLKFEGTHIRSGLFMEGMYGTKALYAEFPSPVERKNIKVSLTVEFSPRKISLVDGSYKVPGDVKKYLEPSKHIPTDGKVREIAKEVTAGKRSFLEKAWAIYEWVVEHTYRDPKVKGCGPGNVNLLLDILEKEGKVGGKCADQSSIFVALCRAVGIPAREVFGIRVLPAVISEGLSMKKGAKDLTKAQHCRAEFWAGGWIPVDPADVTKLALKEKLPKNHPRVDFAKRYLFGNWDPHWIAYNWGRDFVLNPPQSLKPLNFFGYPYAEIDGEPLNWLEPDRFVYRIRKFTA